MCGTVSCLAVCIHSRPPTCTTTWATMWSSSSARLCSGRTRCAPALPGPAFESASFGKSALVGTSVFNSLDMFLRCKSSSRNLVQISVRASGRIIDGQVAESNPRFSTLSLQHCATTRRMLNSPRFVKCDVLTSYSCFLLVSRSAPAAQRYTTVVDDSQSAKYDVTNSTL